MLAHLSSIWSCMNKKPTVISVFLLRNAEFLNFKKKNLFILRNLFKRMMPPPVLLASVSSGTGSHAHDPMACV